MTASPQIHPRYRPDIDGLRAIAVLAVIGFHAFPNWIKGGFVGVDIFFVISGFLISLIIFGNLENGNFSYADFYARRIKRIFPALLLVLITTLAFGWYVLLGDEYTQLGKHTAAGMGFVANLAFWQEAGYFDNSADSKPLLHLWSLGVEEQFYIVWPLVMALAWKSRKNFLSLTILIALASFAFSLFTIRTNQIADFYSPLTRFWELMVGGIIAYLSVHKPHTLARAPIFQSLMGMSLILVSIFVFTKTDPFPGYFALLPVFGAALVISGGASPINRHLIGNKLAVAIGLISYPLYLWHWPLIVLSKISLEHLLTVKERVVIIAAAFILAGITYLVLEKPIRKNPFYKPAIALFSAGAIVMGFGLCVFTGHSGPRLKSAEISKFLTAAYDWDFPGATAKRLSIPGLHAFEYASGSEKKTVYIGDSNLEQYAPRIAQTVTNHPEYNSAIIIGNQDNCNVTAEIFVHTTCDEALEKTRDLLKDDRIDTVVLVAGGSSYHDNMAESDRRVRFEKFVQETTRTKRVYIVLNMPDGDSVNPKEMFTGSRLTQLTPKTIQTTHFDYAGFIEKYGTTRQALKNLAVQNNAQIIDPLETLCKNHVCPIFDEHGNPLYKDSTHMRPFYVKSASIFIDIPLVPALVPLKNTNSP